MIDKIYRLVIADGNAAVRSALHCLAEHEEDCSVIAEDASFHSLLRTLSRDKPEILFLDSLLPGMPPDGLKLLKCDHPGLAIILMGPDALASGRLPEGICCAVSKRDEPAAVVRALKAARRLCHAQITPPPD